ncbi:unnamed protein product [Candidula unifasciata]|uniref:EF-hand domain-containing protein n=1 Tax=Candidula unifasciata TaxID=100452 RepID=A0A8S3YW12_9EUPU|nr:unnamed protein product [Candidula unifasciata]
MPQFEDNVKTFFTKADKDKSGCLSAVELYQVLLNSGFGGTADDVQCWFESIDKNKDKKISLEELLHHLSLRDPKSVEESELRALFQKIDKDKSGRISVDELQALLTQHGRKGKAEKYIASVDKDQDGKINFEEFLKMWKEDC